MNPISRRNFVLASAAAAGATWFDVPRVMASSIEESRAAYGGFDFGIQAHSLKDFPLEEAVEIIQQKLDLHWVEFSSAHVANTIPMDEVDGLRKLLSAHDIACNAHGVNKFDGDHEKNRKIFEFAKAMGVANLSANPTADSFDSLEELVRKFGIRIAIHNHGPGSSYDTIRDMKDATEGRDPKIGYCLDMGHTIRSAEDPVKAIYELKDRLYGIHMKDFAEQTKQTEIVVIGQGHLDVEGAFRALREVEFPADGVLSLEFEGKQDDKIASLKQNLRAASKAAKKAAKS